MKRLQISVTKEAHKKILDAVKQCNHDFLDGHVGATDVVDWLIETASFDIGKIRHRCLNPNKIKANAQLRTKSDIDALIKKLNMIRPLLNESGIEDRDAK